MSVEVVNDAIDQIMEEAADLGIGVDTAGCGVDGEWCTWEAQNSQPYLALTMTGMIAMINAIMPFLLLMRWKFESAIVLVKHDEENKLYYHGWLVYFLGSVLLYGLPALTFPLCFLEIDIIDHFFVWWMDFLLRGYWSIAF